MYVSLKDVAERAGVSFQTASKVLNGQHGVVSAKTRERIVAAADELGYVPNRVARSLVQRSTYTVGIVADDLDDSVLTQFTVGAEAAARRRGHAVLIGTVRGENEGDDYVRLLLERRVDGILAAAPSLEDDAAVGELLRGPVPVVSMHHVPGGGVPLVGSDHTLTGRLATEHLAALGRTRIATVTGQGSRRVAKARLRGYELALSTAGLAVDAELVAEGDWTPQGGYRAAGALFDLHGDIDAVFAQNDLMAIGVLAAAHERGRRIPDDCAVVGCDDLPFSPFLTPPLTSVHIPFAETGERAMELLLRLIAGEEERANRILLPVHLVARASTEPSTEVATTWD